MLLIFEKHNRQWVGQFSAKYMMIFFKKNLLVNSNWANLKISLNNLSLDDPLLNLYKLYKPVKYAVAIVICLYPHWPVCQELHPFSHLLDWIHSWFNQNFHWGHTSCITFFNIMEAFPRWVLSKLLSHQSSQLVVGRESDYPLPNKQSLSGERSRLKRP